MAENNSLPIPDEDETDRALGHRPEVAITKVSCHATSLIHAALLSPFHGSIILLPASQVFRWQSAIDDWGEAQSLAFDFGQIYGRRIREHSFTPRPGVLRLLETLNNYEVRGAAPRQPRHYAVQARTHLGPPLLLTAHMQVPCCLCSGLDEDMTEEAVADAGLDGLFQKVASQRPRRRVDAIVCTSPRSHGSPATAHCLP